MSELINNRQRRIEILKEVILHLHRGEAPEQVRAQLAALVQETDAGEIAAMEEQLLRDGMSVDEVRSMCDLHAQVTRDLLREPPHAAPLPAGHPVATLQAENRAIERTCRDLRAALTAAVDGDGDAAAAGARLREGLNALMDVGKHYARKENLLFPCLERHGVTGPSKVMWAKDDEARELLKAFDGALRAPDGLGEARRAATVLAGRAAVEAVAGMVLKEEKILLPMAQGLLTEEEWGDVWAGSPQFGWCLVEPGRDYSPPRPVAPRDTVEVPRGRALVFPSGALTFDQLLGIFSALPVNLTFVDADDRVAFFSEGPDRVFPRAATVIGRKVQHCHPPRSVDIVERILADFRAGRQSMAEFWIELHGKFVHIRYFAVRDAAGGYLGTLEVTQDLARLRQLSGERRLLAYDAAAQPASRPPRR